MSPTEFLYICLYNIIYYYVCCTLSCVNSYVLYRYYTFHCGDTIVYGIARATDYLLL